MGTLYFGINTGNIQGTVVIGPGDEILPPRLGKGRRYFVLFRETAYILRLQVGKDMLQAPVLLFVPVSVQFKIFKKQ